MIAFARVALIRLVRDRTNIFFVVLFPLLIVLLVGLQFGGAGSLRLGIVGGVAGDGLRTALTTAEVDIELVELADADAARAAVEDGDVDAAVLVPEPDPGPTGEIAFLANPDGSDIAIRTVVAAAVDELEGPLRAATALVEAGVVEDAATATTLVAGAGSVGPEVTTSMLGEAGLAAEFAGLGQFDLGASTQLLLFVFLTSLVGSTAVVQARRWGVLDRALTSPTSPAAVIGGLALGQLAVAGVQAVVIVAATSLVFGVEWGDPLATSAVVVLFAAVAAVAGLLLGTLLRNEEQVGGVAVPLGLALAAFGGCMLPLELFPEPLRVVSRLTPHAWGNLAFAEIVRRDGGVLDILPELGMLLVFASVLGAAAAVALGRRLRAG